MFLEDQFTIFQHSIMAANEKNNDVFKLQIKTTEQHELQKQQEFGNELPESNLKQNTSDFGALLHIIKSSLGAGVLAMPYAFKNAGLIFGIVATCFVAIIVTHTTALLVDCSQFLRTKFNKIHMSYADTIEYAFIYAYGEKKKNFAKKSRNMVDFFLFVTYYGTLSYYVLLMASTFKQVIDKHTSTALDIRVYTLSIFVLIFPVGSIRRFKYLVPFSAIANLLLIIALGLILCEVFRDLPSIHSRSAIQPFNRWPIFFSLVFFGLEGIGTILPLENEMKNPNHLTHSPRLLYFGMIFTMTINLIIGFFGYLKYGTNVKGVISLNLPDDWLSETIKLTVALVVLFTYGLLMTAPMEAVWYKIRPYIEENISLHYYGLRTFLILGNVLIATALPSLAGIIGLIGALGLSMLGVFMPAFIELLCLSKEESGCITWKRIKNLFLLMFAVFFAVVGIYSSILEMTKIDE